MTNRIGMISEYDARKIDYQTIIADKISGVFKTLIYILLNEKVNVKFNNKCNTDKYTELFRDAHELPLDTIDSITFKFTTPKGKQLKISDVYDFNVSLLMYHQLIDLRSHDRKIETPTSPVHRGLMYQSILLKLFYSLMDILNTYNDSGECKVDIQVQYIPLFKVSKHKPLTNSRCKRWCESVKRVLSGDTLNVSTCNVKVIDLYILMHGLFSYVDLDYLADYHLPGVLNAKCNLNKFSTLELNLIYWLNHCLDEPMIQIGGLNNGLKLSIKKYSTHYVNNRVNNGNAKIFEDITLFSDIPYKGDNVAMYNAYRSGFYYHWFIQVAMVLRHQIAVPEHLTENAEYVYKLNYIAGFKQNTTNEEICLSKKEIKDVFYQLISYSHFGLGHEDNYVDIFKTFEYVNSRDMLHDLLTGFYKQYYLGLTLS